MKGLRRRDSKGSSLVFVIIAVAFVGILGSILLNVTMINIQTKVIDKDVKKSFYNAESVMDKLNISLQNISAQAMKEAYVTLLSNYTGDVMDTTDQAAIQASFAENYINNLLSKITDGSRVLTKAVGADVEKEKKYDRVLIDASYDVNKIRTQIRSDFPKTKEDPTDYGEFIQTDTKDAKVDVYFTGSKVDNNRYLLLKNVKVKHFENEDATNKDAGTSTWITTDVKFTVPILRFEGGGTYPNFTEYTIIGDEEVTAKGTASVIDGSVYAGYKGFNTEVGSNVLVKRKSANLITRGDVTVDQGSTLTIGEDKSLVNVYAMNYTTKKSTTTSNASANLNIYADSYIMDDMTLNAPYSNVFLGGENAAYFGYTFNKDNTVDTKTRLSSAYSSAMIINGKHSSLLADEKMSSILLGGRAYISRFNQGNRAGYDKNDILMGESISIKSDQNFYLVASEHMKDGFTNPMTLTAYNEKFRGTEGENDVTKREVLADDITSRKTKLSKLLKSGKGQGVIPYVYSLGNKSDSAAMVYFYYNFKSQEAADTFFADFCDHKELGSRIVNTEYLQFGPGGLTGNGIMISPSIALFSASNYISFPNNGSAPGEYEVWDKTINSGDEAMLKQQAVDYSKTYKALAMELSTKNKEKYESTYDGSNTNKSNGYGMGTTDATTNDVLDDNGNPLIMGNQVFDSIMTVNKTTKKHAFVEDKNGAGFKTVTNGKVKAVPVEVNGKTVWVVFIVADNVASLTEGISLNGVLSGITYEEKNGANKPFNSVEDVALVVANCNIKVDRSIRGLVISDQSVFVQSDASITAEPALLRAMFRKQRTTEGSREAKDKFITYFAAFAGFTAGADSSDAEANVDISTYISYSNWKKNSK